MHNAFGIVHWSYYFVVEKTGKISTSDEWRVSHETNMSGSTLTIFFYDYWDANCPLLQNARTVKQVCNITLFLSYILNATSSTICTNCCKLHLFSLFKGCGLPARLPHYVCLAQSPRAAHRTRGQVEVGCKPLFHFPYPLPGRNKTNPWCSAQKAQGQFLDLPFKWLLHKLRTARTAWEHKGFFSDDSSAIKLLCINTIPATIPALCIPLPDKFSTYHWTTTKHCSSSSQKTSPF